MGVVVSNFQVLGPFLPPRQIDGKGEKNIKGSTPTYLKFQIEFIQQFVHVSLFEYTTKSKACEGTLKVEHSKL